MRSLQSIIGLTQTAHVLRWGQAVCGALPAYSRQLASSSNIYDETQPADIGSSELVAFDAAEEAAPVAVHQLIGDPRTGIADDTTTTPWGDDVSVEWIWSSPSNGVDWYRYSMAGPDQLPHMYMDSRLSDHSKNLMYMLRCKDPQRWTIPALADKFRIRRQRVMAILTLKEMQAHRIEQGQDMRGPLQPYTFKVPLQDFHIQPDGQPVDLAQCVADQQQQMAAARASRSSASGTAADGTAGTAANDVLGSLEDFLAPADKSAETSQQQPDALSSLGAAAGGQAADLAALMPQVALTTQQLQLQLLQLLQQHQYSMDELQRRLLQQVDVAEAYYNAHVAGTPLEQMLLGSSTKAAPAADEAGSEGAAAAARPAWLDFAKQRQDIQQVINVLAPVLQYAGSEQDREAGRLLAALKHALQEASTDTANQEQQADNISALVKSAEPAVFAAAFNQLGLHRKQQLLNLAPDARIALNVHGTDLKASLSSSSSEQEAGVSSSAGATAAAPATWPGQVPTVVDVWQYEEVPKKQVAALQQQLHKMQQLLAQADAACSSSGSQSVTLADLEAVQKAVQVYYGLVWEYDKVLGEQAAALSGTDEAPVLPKEQQRRLIRVLRETDMHALEKLLLWESYYKESEAAESEEKLSVRDTSRLNRLKRKIHAAIKQLDAAAVSEGQPSAFEDYPDLPAETPAANRVDKDMAFAHLDAVVVGRQFHRGSGDRNFYRIDSYPKFEGYSLEEFDQIQEGELSTLSRLAAERQDNMMWKEFRERLLRNIGLTAPDLYQHITKARPPKPQKGWSYVVHPVGGSARAFNRQQMKQQAVQQWLDDDVVGLGTTLRPGDFGAAQQQFDPAHGPAPAEPYVAEPGRKIRGLTEEEKVVIGASRPKPRRRWYASTRSRIL